MAVLYRKYRPQKFSEVVGQKAIIKTLQNQVILGQVAHAYLFTGSRGVGKTSIARILAKAVNCTTRSEFAKTHPNDPKENKDEKSGVTDKAGDACGECEICKQVQAGSFIDLVEIDAASNTGVDNIREIIEHVKFSPSLGKYKVIIIDEVHMLSKGAFNALLKTLEEPPKHAIFILATTETGKVPATIISRTQKFDFRLYSPEEVKGHIEKILSAEGLGLPEEIVELVAKNSQGGLRDALSLLDKILTLGTDATVSEYQMLLGVTDTATCENFLELIVSGKASEIPGWLDTLGQRGLDFSIVTREFLEYLRKVLVSLVTQGKVQFFSNPSNQEKLSQFASSLTLNELLFIIRLFLKAYKDLFFSPDPKLPVLLAALEASVKKNATIPAKPLTTVPAVSEQVQTPAVAVKPSVVQAETYDAVSNVSIDPARLLEFWPSFIEHLKKINGPLANVVKNSQMLGVSSGRVRLGVKFLFHKQSLENPKNYNLILQQLSLACGQQLGLAVEIVKEEGLEETKDPVEALGDALKILGGEVVE